MKLLISPEPFLSSKADLLAVPIVKGAKNPLLVELDRRFGGEVFRLMAKQKFEGESGISLLFPSFGKIKTGAVLLIGLGSKSEIDLDSFRKFAATFVKRAKESKARRLAISWESFPTSEMGNHKIVRVLAEGAMLADYQFHAYRKDVAAKARREAVESLSLHSGGSAALGATLRRGFDEGEVLAQAVALSRDLVNTPSCDMTPRDLAEAARSVAGGRIKIKILDKQVMLRLSMGGALGVAQGSMHEPVGIHLTYRPKSSARLKRIAIVGKAVTFDSGGLSLKPSDSMTTMKIDMAGAAAVIGLFQALPSLNPQAEVHGIFLAVENMPSGSAYRPGDVLKTMSGQTVEVLNTDAEGRITLADALSYAVKQKPDVIIDLATLTGACVSSLGEEMAGLFTNDRRLADRLLRASRESGEDIWEQPLYKPYRELIKSKIADLKNTSPRGAGAGAITAALFLESFVAKTPWAHLDIAGPAYTERETRSDLPYGGSGFGVRLLARYLQGL